MPKFTELESFMQLLHAVQKVQRVARVPDEKQYRNTAEHTFELAMVCWYIATTNKLALDQEKILKYALAHDLIEAYAGDTFINDTQARKDKVLREETALVQLTENFQEFPELIEIIHSYEEKADVESVFVYATDKLIDPLNASMEKTQSIWKDNNMTYVDLREYKDPKIALSKDIQPYWEELCKKLEANKDFFFNE